MMEPLERALDLPGAHLTLLTAEPATGAISLALDLVKQ